MCYDSLPYMSIKTVSTDRKDRARVVVPGLETGRLPDTGVIT